MTTIRQGRSSESGAGLVELMVGLTIGLVILAFITSLFSSSTQMGSAQADQSRLQESARLALQLIGYSIRQSGYNHNILLPLNYTPLEGSAGANVNTADQITLRRHAANGAGGSQEQDCTGRSVTAGDTIVETYYLGAPASAARTQTSLYCRNGETPAAVAELVPSVVNMKLSFGLDANRDGTIDAAYVTGDPGNYADVAVVRVELTLAGETPTGFTRPSGTKYCDAHADRTCLTFTNSFLLRNRTPQ